MHFNKILTDLEGKNTSKYPPQFMDKIYTFRPQWTSNDLEETTSSALATAAWHSAARPRRRAPTTVNKQYMYYYNTMVEISKFCSVIVKRLVFPMNV